ncbi:hypothetical protein ACLK2I_06875 [Escherichia coli]
MINPAHPPLALIGVYSPATGAAHCRNLARAGYQRAAVVHSGGMVLKFNYTRRQSLPNYMTAKLRAIN